MTPILAAVIDHSISIVAGIIGTLLGYRVLGPKSNTNPKYDAIYVKWTKHLKWLGPAVIVLGLVQVAIAIFGQT